MWKPKEKGENFPLHSQWYLINSQWRYVLKCGEGKHTKGKVCIYDEIYGKLL